MPISNGASPSPRPWAPPRRDPGRKINTEISSKQRFGGGVQQDRFVDQRCLARRRQAQCRHGQFVHLAGDALGGLIQTLTGGVIEQRLSHAGGFELLRQIGIEFLARKSLQVIVRADALA